MMVTSGIDVRIWRGDGGLSKVTLGMFRSTCVTASIFGYLCH